MRRCSRAGERGGDFSGDMAGLANAADQDGSVAGENELDGFFKMLVDSLAGCSALASLSTFSTFRANCKRFSAIALRDYQTLHSKKQGWMCNGCEK